MKVAAFDSKPFRRGRKSAAPNAPPTEQYTGFHTQLGMGVTIPDAGAFGEAFAAEFARLKKDFGVETECPFLPTNGLLRHGRPTAIALADRLVASVQHLIEGAYCSYVLLPTRDRRSVSVGGFDCPVQSVPTMQFINNLGPMFSYLTAQSYVHAGKGAGDEEIRIDSFLSKQTKAWDSLKKRNPKVYWRGDECDPAIACADLLAFLTDAKLFQSRLRLDREGVAKAWSTYPFDVDVGIYSSSNLALYAWYSNSLIDVRPYAAKPTVFLSVDEIADPSSSDGDGGPESAAGGDDSAEPPLGRHTPFHEVIKQSPVYDSAVRLAFEMSGSLKIFKYREDAGSVHDGDAFVYVGEKSKRAGMALADAADVTVMSGADLRRKYKKSNKVTSHSW